MAGSNEGEELSLSLSLSPPPEEGKPGSLNGEGRPRNGEGVGRAEIKVVMQPARKSALRSVIIMISVMLI